MKAKKELKKMILLSPNRKKHPLQVPDEELDGIFNDAPPEGADNETDGH